MLSTNACTVFTISQSVAVTLSGMTIRHGLRPMDRAGGIDIPILPRP